MIYVLVNNGAKMGVGTDNGMSVVFGVLKKNVGFQIFSLSTFSTSSQCPISLAKSLFILFLNKLTSPYRPLG